MDTPAPRKIPRWGAVHIHTTYSDGRVTLEDTVEAALGAGLDFALITDHNTLGAREHEGYVQGLLLLADVELTPSPFHNHLLALGLEDCAHLHRAGSQERMLREVEAAGGTAWVPHPRGFLNPWFGLWNRPWSTWNQRVRGIELATFLVQWAEEVRPWNLFRRLRDPGTIHCEPDARTLACWDRLNSVPRATPAVGFVGLDAHYRSLIGGRISTPAYDYLFRTYNVLAWCEPPTGDGARDAAALRAALVAGDFINVFFRDGEERQCFEFREEAGSITCSAPDPEGTEIRLLRDGRAVTRVAGAALVYDSAEPGVYRAEVRCGGRLRALTNPLRVRAENESQPDRDLGEKPKSKRKHTRSAPLLAGVSDLNP